MCGISGLVTWNSNSQSEPYESLGARWLTTLHHRGPDENGKWFDQNALLVHNRLSIIGLSTGQQPMISEDGRYILVYNGELYNFLDLRKELENLGYRFRTNSDTEVVLYAFAEWNEKALVHFNGMYSFGIWDRAEKQIFIARDRVGIKPLFYYQDENFVAFSSEIQGLLALNKIEKKLDLRALDLYLHYQYVPAPLTIFSGIRKLLPAHYLRLSLQHRHTAPIEYWKVQFNAQKRLSLPLWKEELHSVVSKCVKDHLVSDVPFGAFLSGGIDSSVVVALMKQHLTSPPRTFTIGFEEAQFDESVYAKEIARKNETLHTCQIIRPDPQHLLDVLLRKFVIHYGEPFADSSAIPTYYVSELARSQVKMVLSGDGGDELFAGYNTYFNILSETLKGSTRSAVGNSLGRRLGKLLTPYRSSTPTDLISQAKSRPTPLTRQLHAQFYAYFQNNERSNIYKPTIRNAIANLNPEILFDDIFETHINQESLSALQYLDLKTYLHGDILFKVDIAAMMHSLEVRVPLLDYRLIELAAQIPAELKINLTSGVADKKYIFKEYACDLMPRHLLERPKQGFGVPIGDWLGGPLYSQVRQRLHNGHGLLSELFDALVINEYVSSPERIKSNGGKIWALLFLQDWADQWGISGI